MRKESNSILNPPFKQALIDKFRNAVVKDRVEWYFRFRHTGYRLLLSYSFYASAKRNVREKSMLLPIIGLYYCYFHLVAALMCVDVHLKYEQLPRFPHDHYRAKRDGIKDFMEKRGIDPKKTRHLSHRRVREYVEDAGRKRILSEDFVSSFSDAMSLRFSVNYAPAYFGNLEMDKTMASLVEQTQGNLDEANRLVFTLNREYVETLDRHGMFWTPQDLLESFIGDAIGDDFVLNYLNEEESKEVFLILDNALPYGKCEVCGKMTQYNFVGSKPVFTYVCESDKCRAEFQAKQKQFTKQEKKRTNKKAKTM